MSSLLSKLICHKYVTKTDTVELQIVFPKDYDSTTNYPVYLALSGGNQSIDIVNYCYAAWFESSYFNNSITILPIAKKNSNLKNYTTSEIDNILKSIALNFKVTDNSWILGGTSNGGRAAFNFLNLHPTLFNTVIVMPGIINKSNTINSNISHVRFLLAYGTNDDKDWIKGTKRSKRLLKNKAHSVKIIPLKGMGHIFPISFDVNLIYDHI